MYVLGVDFGTKKLGLAILETDSSISSPLPVLKHDMFVFDILTKYIKEYRVTTLVFGMPTYEGTKKKMLTFVEQLKKRHPELIIDFTEESNTSLGIKKELTTKKQKANLDSFSAVAIVQQWCSEH